MIRIARLVRDLCLVVFCVLVVAGCGGGSSSSSGATSSSAQTSANHDFGSNNPLKVTAFGDSITQGVLELRRRSLGLSTANNYPALLQSTLRRLDPSWVVVNRGIGGEHTSEGRARIASTLRADKPGYVLIMEGSNDAHQCQSSGAAVNNLRGMVQAARANNSIVIIGTVPPSFRNNPCADDVIFDINAQIPGIAMSEGATVADIFNGMNDRSLFGITPDRDPLHPNEQGYAVMANIWYKAMLDVIPGGATVALRRRR